MAIKCGFFNSKNGDRVYDADDMSQPYVGLISNGVIPDRPEEGDEDQRSLAVGYGSTNRKIIITKGRGIFSNKWFWLDADLEKDIPSNNTLSTHYASVIVRIDNRADHRVASVDVIQNDIPTLKPQINTIDDVVEYRLADITIPPSEDPITIEDTRMLDECGFVTGLVNQLSTEEIYLQWQKMFSDWFDDVQVSLKTQATLTTSFTSSYKALSTTTNIPIGIPQYNKNLDVLQVSINGLDIYEGIDYTIVDNTRITLAKSIYAGNIVLFTALKSIDGSQASTIVQEFQDIQQIVNSIKPQVDNLVLDSGWINFQLEAGSAITGLAPAVRRVGNVVYLRGALSGITTTSQTQQITLCTLPEAYAPMMEHYFTHLVGGTGASVGYTSVRFKVNRNQASGGNATIVINGSSGTINANQTIPISTSFVLG